MNGNNKTLKTPIKYICEMCDFITCNKKDYSRHNETKKHKMHESQCLSINNTPKTPKFQCENCEKTYKDYSGLWRHKKKCVTDITDESGTANNVSDNNNDLINYLISENQEFKKLILELAKDKSINTSNSHNSFNLNFFLNETCKGALNISEFVDSLKLQLKDLENVGKLGYVEGISKIIINGLKELDVTKRPIHCSDLKRETLYVKDANIWENDKEKERMKNTIQHVAAKNFKQLPEWVKENPESKDTESKKHNEYMHIINKITGGMTEEEDDKNYNKIIKKVATEVVIEKEP